MIDDSPSEADCEEGGGGKGRSQQDRGPVRE